MSLLTRGDAPIAHHGLPNAGHRSRLQGTGRTPGGPVFGTMMTTTGGLG
jgi:hypothetical protein